MAGKKTLIKNGLFITMDESAPYIQGFMVIEDDVILSIGTGQPEALEHFDEIIDGTHRLYMPGLVNTHGHAAMSLLRGYADDLALKVWLEEKMWPIEGKFTAVDVRAGTRLSLVEMLKSGTTCFVDMYDKMDEVARTVQESGMRACLTRGIIGFPASMQDNKLKEATDFAKNWHRQADGRITTMMSPHSPYTCPPEFIERVVQAAHDLALPIHTHMSETIQEVKLNEEQYGLRPVAHLEKLGVFSRPALVAHAVHLTDEEIAILKKYHVNVSHNPGSNLKLASGVARVTDLLREGITVSLGTDSSASNNNLDMFEEIRLAALIHKGVTGDPTAIPATEALRMGTVYGAKSIWLDQVGTLKPGMKADVISVNIDQPHFQPKTDFYSHLVYSAAGQDVMDVCVDGRWLVRNRECLTLDEEKVMFEANQCLQRLTS